MFPTGPKRKGKRKNKPCLKWMQIGPHRLYNALE